MLRASSEQRGTSDEQGRCRIELSADDAGAYVLPATLGRVTLQAVLDAIEERHPVLRGTIHDHGTKQRRAFVRYFACEKDWSLESPDAELPESIVTGKEPFMVVGAIAGG